MSATGIAAYSTTAGSNATVGSVNFAEGQTPSSVNDSARAEMADIAAWFLQIAGGTVVATCGGTADALTLTKVSNANAVDAYRTGQRFIGIATNTNATTTPTLNVDALGAKTIIGPRGETMAAGDITTGDFLFFAYDGTNMRLQYTLRSTLASAQKTALRNAQTGTTYTVLAGDLGKYLTFSNASSIAVTQPQATGSFANGWYAYYENIGAGVVTITPTTSTINTGTALVLRQGEWAFIASDGTNYRTLTTGQITGSPAVRESGTRGVPQNVQSGTYAFVLSDAGGHVFHDSGSAHTWTIPANASVAFPIGTAITLINNTGGGAVTLAITTDTLRRGDGTAGTGSRTIGADSVATIIKTKSTEWMVTGKFS